MKKTALTLIFTIAIILIIATPTFAYQSTPYGDPTKITPEELLKGIRQMETSGAGMALTEKINETTLQSENGSNAVDIHTQKNTEYGAMLLLSASHYGKQGNGTVGSNYLHTSTYGLATTTGNKSGIYDLDKPYEFVAATGLETSSYITGANTRYVNIYLNSIPFIGDATLETNKWRGITEDSVMPNNGDLVLRNVYGIYKDSAVATSKPRYSRACMVMSTNHEI